MALALEVIRPHTLNLSRIWKTEGVKALETAWYTSIKIPASITLEKHWETHEMLQKRLYVDFFFFNAKNVRVLKNSQT